MTCKSPPRIYNSKKKKKKRNRGLEAPYAVVAFVHGESYEWNSGNPYEGTVLTSYGHVIVVTINYRLGILARHEKKEKETEKI
ncbi:conserved hypothetical protein [Pediculus humanus corporis]|uniref:Carboxylesterase type B domain-containing protein n=1 Tax=Pediculus humanus subsp. corporis TaxID=121224 RepID=E0VU76_PEDHC|nr:uncharacterized protein Phum_PHUM447130 [Pediculus humanus corporis]EEB16932.1 conserved hypothetical protein [Pediculus humanus corporis]